jgi:uncharacterized protein YbaA (DUF1428 family)
MHQGHKGLTISPKQGNLSDYLRRGVNVHKSAIASRLIDLATNSNHGASANLKAIALIFERLEGAPRQAIDHSVNRAQSMTRQEMQDELAKAGLVQIEHSPLDAIECTINDIDNSESTKVELPVNPVEEEENKRKELVRTKHARDAEEAVRIRMETHRINIAKEESEGELVGKVDDLLSD